MTTLTLQNFTDLIEFGYEGNENTELDVNSLAIIGNTTSDKLKKMSPHKFAEFKQELLTQAVASKPVYLLKYKGEMFGYCPPEIDTVEAMIAMEQFVKTKNWNALAALMFRRVKGITKFWFKRDKEWTDRFGVQVKEITSFPKNKITYSTKNVDFENVDLSFWDELPANILISNLAFSIGSGLLSSLLIPSYSQSEVMMKTHKKMAEKIQQAIGFSLLQNTALGLECLSSTVGIQSSSVNQENYSTGWFTSIRENLKRQIKTHSWELTGKKNKDVIDNFFSFVESLGRGELNSNELMLLSSIGKTNNVEAKIGLLGWQR